MTAFLFTGYGFWLGVLIAIVLILGTHDALIEPRASARPTRVIRVEMVLMVVIALIIWCGIFLFAKADWAPADISWQITTISVSQFVIKILLIKLFFWATMYPWFSKIIQWIWNEITYFIWSILGVY